MSDGGYKDLIVWQKSILLVKDIYALTGQFPQMLLKGRQDVQLLTTFDSFRTLKAHLRSLKRSL